MTVSTTNSVIEYTGNGSTTTFPVPFMFLADADLVVTTTTADGLTTKTLVRGTDYSVIGAGAQAGGAVIAAVAPAAGVALAVSRELQAVQETDLRNQGRFYAETHEKVFDRLTMLIQQAFGIVGRALVRPIGKKYFDAQGLQIKNVADPTAAQDAATMSWAQQYVASILNTGQGPVNNAANVVYTKRDGSATSVQAFGSGVETTLLYLGLPHRTLESFGAVGDGSTDDSAKVQAALNSGYPIVGTPGKTYALASEIALPATFSLGMARFIDIAPGGTSRRLFNGSATTSGKKAKFYEIYINRNGSGTGGAVGTAAAIWLTGFEKVETRGVEITGADRGNGIVTASCTNVSHDAPYIHDMTYGNSTASAATDDQIQGIWTINDKRVNINDPRIINMTGQWSGQASFARFSRGIAVGGSVDVTITSPQIDNVDQGIDFTGDMVPDRYTIQGGSVNNCFTWGVKAANSARDGKVIGVTAYACGNGGFVASAPGAGFTGAQYTGRLVFIGCHAIACGSTYWNGLSNTAGFRISSSATYTDQPRDIKFIGCGAYGDGASMKYGFCNDAVIGGNGDIWVEAINCSVSGAATARMIGMHQGFHRKTITAALALASGAWTNILWPNTDFDRMSGNGADLAHVVARKAGLYTVSAGLEFAGNSTGTRGIRLNLNDGQIAGSLVRIAAGDANARGITTTVTIPLDVGDTISCQAIQESGSSLNLTGGALTVTMIEPGFGRTQ